MDVTSRAIARENHVPIIIAHELRLYRNSFTVTRLKRDGIYVARVIHHVYTARNGAI